MAIEFQIRFLRHMTIFLSLAQTWLIGYMLADMKCAPGQAERFFGINDQILDTGCWNQGLSSIKNPGTSICLY